jgi:hypothetical protein
MRFACFDLETAFYTGHDIELLQGDNGINNIWDIWPFGIAVAAIKLSDRDMPEIWFETVEGRPAPYWSREFTIEFVLRLEQLEREGYTLVTWNGSGFDFRLLFKLTRLGTLKAMCWRSVDPCFQMLCMKGFPVGLEAAATTVGAKSKEEDGISAPILWYEGEYGRVIRYVIGDVIRLETVIINLCKEGGLKWRTRKGALRFEPFYNLYSVAECIGIAMPDTSWMTPDPEREPITRESTIGWLEEESEFST